MNHGAQRDELNFGGRSFTLSTFTLEQLEQIGVAINQLMVPRNDFAESIRYARAVIESAVKGQIDGQELAQLPTTVEEITAALVAIANAVHAKHATLITAAGSA